jgi:predicted Zn-dependent protease
MNAPTPFRVLLLGGALFAAVAAPAQFSGLDKLTKGLDKFKQTTDKAKEVHDDVSKASKGVLGIGPKEEEQMGGTVALEVVGRYGGLVRDEAISRRINLVGRSLARYSDRPDLPWRFAVLNSDTVNAFSAPYGYVFITRGLYDLCTNDDLLAGVLGHEITHITNKDALRIVASSDFASVGLKYAKQSNRNVQQFDASVSQVGSSVSQISPEVGKFFDLNSDKIVKTLINSGYGQETEFKADHNGRDLAAATDFAPGGLRASLVMLQAKGGDSKKFFPSHPALADRLKKLPDDPAPAAQ